MNKMKNLLLVAMCLIATSAVTSCLNSDDDSLDPRLTAEEETAYLYRLSGTYTGKMFYTHNGRTKDGTKDSTYRDSIKNICWVINSDSTIIIKDFPDSIYNNAIRNNADLRKIMEKAPKRDLKCTFAPYRYNSNGVIDYAFQLLPKTESTESSQYAYTKNEFMVDDTKYTMQYGYAIYYGGVSSMGYQPKTGYTIEFQLLLADIKCTPSQQLTIAPDWIYFKGSKGFGY